MRRYDLPDISKIIYKSYQTLEDRYKQTMLLFQFIFSIFSETHLDTVCSNIDRLCGLVVIVLGYRSGGQGSIPGTTRKKSSGSGTGSTQRREYNWGATW
jgi:hypothetical protein